MVSSTADDVLRRERELRVADWSDDRLVAEVAHRVRIPRRDPADSFVLHAPLEVMARAALLPHVGPAHHEQARRRFVSLLVHYEAWEPIEVPDPAPLADDPAASTARLLAALAAGELEDVDRAAAALADAVPAATLSRLLADALLPSLAAAGHAPILLYHLPRLAGRERVPGALLRPLVREVARHPSWRIEWLEEDRHRPAGTADALAAALVDAPRLDLPDGGFVFPVMHQVDASGDAARVGATATGVPPTEAAPVLLRHAARAMIVADEVHMPYGWSHALTMSQGAVGLAPVASDPQRAVDVATTFVLGFLAAEAAAPVPSQVELAAPGGSFSEVRAGGRAAAAGWVLGASAGEVAEAFAEIVDLAATAHDAHLVKYVLAVRDARRADPAATSLYVAAAGALLAFWEAVGDAHDPLTEVPTVS